MKYLGRLAPTPSGYLHVGNAFNFLLTWLQVRVSRGTLRLRIDDIDSPRTRSEYLDDIFYALEWLEIDWDLGPQNVDDHQKTYSQSLSLERYQSFIQRLENLGLLFACTCSRADIAAISPSGLYPGTCLHKKIPLTDAQTALRCNTTSFREIEIMNYHGLRQVFPFPHEMQFPVLRRKDLLPAYQICSLADDIEHNINFIVRGQDLWGSTCLQMALATALGAENFKQIRFLHHPLVTDDYGIKLSKSAGSISLAHYRAMKDGRLKLMHKFSQWLGWKERASNTAQLLQLAGEGASVLPPLSI